MNGQMQRKRLKKEGQICKHHQSTPLYQTLPVNHVCVTQTGIPRAAKSQRPGGIPRPRCVVVMFGVVITCHYLVSAVIFDLVCCQVITSVAVYPSYADVRVIVCSLV